MKTVETEGLVANRALRGGERKRENSKPKAVELIAPVDSNRILI